MIRMIGFVFALFVATSAQATSLVPRLVHGRKRFGIVYVCSGILRGHQASLAVHCRREHDLSLSAVGACCYI